MMNSNVNKGDTYANVQIVGHEKRIPIPISSASKPEIPATIMKKWQNIIDILAKTCNVPAALIMRLHEENIEVFLTSHTNTNPYHKRELAPLGSGLYCETVVGKRFPLLVPDALQDPHWEKNPDVDLNMISYYGIPLTWMDGEIFGTLCILDREYNAYNQLFFDLMDLFKNSIEYDLELLMEKDALKQLNIEKDILLRETHHRIKNNFNFLIQYLRLQSIDNFDDSISKDIQSKLHSIALLHDRLAQTAGLSESNLNEYIKELVELILKTSNRNDITYEIIGTTITIPQKELVICGLIINELVTNSLKHSLKDKQEYTIYIDLSLASESCLHVDYSDTGGVIESVDRLIQSESLGMNIIQAFTEQLRGTFTIRTDSRTHFVFDFRI